MTEQEIPDATEQDRRVRIHFSLPVDEDGWPPTSIESMWASPRTEADLFVLDNIPFFVRGVSDGDTVRVEADDDGTLWAVETVSWSGNCTIRVVPFPALTGGRQAVLDTFAPLGVEGEGIEQFEIVALNVPPDADLHEVQRLLHRGADEGWWDYEEGSVGDAWEAAAPR